MKKICVSIETDDFKKGMKDIPEDIREETQKFIQELIDAENNFNPGDKTKDKEEKAFPRQEYGNTLSAQDNRNIFSLKTKYRFRFVAAVIEDEKTKSYVWFFAKSHEAYKKEIVHRTKELRQKENQLSNSQKVEDAKEIQVTVFQEQQKQKIGQNIDQMRKDARSTHGKKNKNRL